MKRGIVLVLVALLLSACMPPKKQMTRQEWLSVTTRDYAGVTVDQALEAAERLLRLADGDDFSVVHSANELGATRQWLVYVVLAAVSGIDTWRVRAIEVPGGVRVTTQVSTLSGAVTPMATTGSAWTATTMPQQGALIDGNGLYTLFYQRLDYLLGKSDTWPDCSVAYKWQEEKVVWGNIEPLCNSFNIEDAKPSEVASAE